jgi:hypothetical protein
MINYLSGGACNASDPFNLAIEINCGSDIFTDVTIDDSIECNPIITFKSSTGCSVASLDALWSWLEKNKIVMMIVFIAVGFVFLIFGRKLFKIIVFLLGVIITVAATWIIFYTYYETDDMN